MELATLEIDETRLIATMTVNRPAVLNALDVATAEAMQAVAAKLAARPDLRCIIVRGAGRAFMAGGDLAGFASDFDTADSTVKQLLDALEPVVMTFQHHPAPVLASVHGAVAGAGISLMAAADLSIAATETRFMLAYDKIGAPPDCGGSYFLPRLLGERRAAALMYLGETWSAEEALQYGLVNKLVSANDLQIETDKLAAKIAAGPTLAYSQYKKLVREGRTNSLQEQLHAERAAFCAATKTADFKIGVSAFIKREMAKFTGR